MLQTTTIDLATLPAAFLPLAKSHARIDHDRDDSTATEYLAQAIDDVERLANVTIFDRTIEGTLDGLGMCYRPTDASARLWTAMPFNNVRSFTATAPDATDVSPAWSLQQADPGGAATTWLGAPPATPWQGVAFSFKAGMASLATIAPSLRRLILRRFAALYEYREAALPLTIDDLAGEPLVWRVEV